MKSHHQDTVNRFIANNNPYAEKEPLRFNLRTYDAYIHEHDITDPDQIPEEVLTQFTMPDQEYLGKLSDDQKCVI